MENLLLANYKNDSNRETAMIEQTARVIRTRQDYAWVVPLNNKACGSCDSQAGCSSKAGLFSFLKPDSEELYVANPLRAKPGDEVVVGVQGSALITYSLLAYLLPLLSMIVFAILGNALFLRIGMEGELGGVLAGVAGLLGGLKLAAWLAMQIARSENACPVVLRSKEQQIIYPAATISHI